MRCFFALVGSLLLFACASGQGGPLLTRLKVPGIEGAEVRSAVMDEYGALWLATDRGVHRFDGSRTESYLNDPLDSLSLTDDSVFEVVLGPDGRVWAATFLGAWCIDPFSGYRQRVPMVFDDGRVGPYECLGLEWAVDGTLWAYCNRGGLARMEMGEDSLRVVWRPSGVSVKGGHVAPDGMVWFTDQRTLVAYDPRSGNVLRFPVDLAEQLAPAKSLLLDVLSDRYDPDVLWCTSWGLGFLRFNKRQQQFDRQLVLHQPLSDLRNIVHGAVQPGPDRWWFSCDGVLFESGSERSGLQRVDPVALAEGGGIKALVHLNGHVTLVGGQGAVYLAMPSDRSLQAITDGFFGKPAHVAPSIDGLGHWLVTFYADRALFRLDEGGRVIGSLPLPQAERPYEAFKVKQTADGIVWLATTRGLLRHRPGTSSVERVPVEAAGAATAQPYVHDLHEDDAGGLWAALSSAGLLEWDLSADGGRCHLPRPGIDGVQPLVLGVDAYDQERLLVNLGDHGPALFDRHTRVFEPMVGARLPAAHFRTATEVRSDRRGRVYVLSRSQGVIRLMRDAEGWAIERRWLPPDRPVFEQVAMDDRGRVWLLSNSGAYLIDPDTDIMHRLDAAHGSPFTVIGGLAAGRSSEVLIQSGEWYRIDKDFQPSGPEPVLMLREARAGLLSVDLRKLLAGDVELSHAINDLQLAFGVVALHEGDAFTYGYRITRDGERSDWSDLGRQRSFSLLDLGPGEYELEVRAESPFSRPVTMAIQFIVLPPWWATWWVRGVAVLLAVLLVVLLTRTFLQRRYRARLRELERERELEKVRMRIARDIHDGIGSGLTRITMLSRQLAPTAGSQAERIAEASAELVNELGEIVWTVDPRNDSFASFMAYVRSVLGRQFEHLQVNLQAELLCADEDRDSTIGPELKRNLQLVLKEAVNNALKHSGASRIEVRLALRAGVVELKVSDDGHGFDPQRIREGANGLANFSKRAEALGGSIQVDTGGKGTTVTFKVPIPPTNM
jgi:signal transduction histidine kinase/streptogramin lyase